MEGTVVSQLVFKVVGYLSSTVSDPLERETLASMQINAGPQRIALTEVEDILAHTVRTHINVPTYEVARWLLANWWRLRWEPQSKGSPSHDWMLRHSMAELGGGYAWPPLVLSSDGEFIQIRVESEDKADVSAIRYLRDLTIDVPASDFEEAVERFVDEVEARISALVPGCRELSDLRQELRDERSDPELAAASKLQALAGIDPGEVSADWLRDAKDLEARIGSVATEEILAVSPAFRGGLADAFSAIWAMRDSEAHVQLGWASSLSRFAQGPDLPWVRGAKLAHEVRRHLGVPSGPISRDTLEQALGVSLPLPKSAWTMRSLAGGYRNGAQDGRTAVLVTKPHEAGQRFYLARVIAAACASPSDAHVLAVSDAHTAFQKLERSFAQEFLCPWSELDHFTDERGTDEDGIAEAAEHFAVSEYLITTTLVNKGKLPRERLLA
ncbi:MAG: hypothetical protein ABSB49_13060 [Polyangia bacterium]